MEDPPHAPQQDEPSLAESRQDLSRPEHADVDALLRDAAARSAAECERDIPRFVARIDRIITEAGLEPPDRGDFGEP